MRDKPDVGQFDFVFSKISEGFAYCKIIVDQKGKPVDWVYLDVNDAYERINGVKKAEVVGKKATEVLPNIKNDPADWITLYGKVALTGDPVTIERYADVRKKWYHISAYSPQKEYFVSIFEDISERKQAEETIRQSEERFSKAFSQSPISVIITRLSDGRYVDVNNAFQRVFGYTRSEVIGHTSPEINIFAAPEGRAAFLSILNKEGRIYNHEMAFRTKDGRVVQTLISVEKLAIDGEDHLLTTLIDITDRNKAEEEIKQAKEDWERTFDAVPDFIAILDTNYRIVRANNAMAKQLGVTPQKAMGLLCYECVHQTTAPPDNCPHSQLLKDGKQHTAEVYEPRLGGDFIVSATPVRDKKGSLIGSVHVARNITERKKAEEALKITLSRFYDTLSNLHGSILLVSAAGQVEFANQAFTEYFNLKETPEELVGVSSRQVINKISGSYLHSEREEQRIAQIIATGKLVTSEEIAMRDGRTCLRDFIPLQKDGGSFSRLWHHMDITPQKKAEEALRESRQRWSTTLSSIGDAVIATDTEGKVTFMNPVAEELTGWTLSEAKQKPIAQIFNIVNEQTRKAVESPVTKVLEKGLVVGLANHTVLIRKDGTDVPIDDSGAPIITDNGVISGVVLVFRDITERKKTEERIQRQAALIDLSPDAIIVRKLDGDITFWSRGAEKLYGWTEAEALGKTTHKLFETKFPEPYEDILSKLKTSKHWSGELVHRTKSGQEVIVQSWWLAEKTEHGEIQSILESNVDLTERKKAEKEIARLATFPALNPNPVFEVDFNGKITYANPATDVFFPDLKAMGNHHPFLADWQEIIRIFEDPLKHSIGRELKANHHWYHQELYHVPETNTVRIYIVDIDELKTAEEGRIKAQTKLEENAVLLEEYANQMEELANQRAQQLKDAERMAAIGQTAGMVGHDIRNPLQAITSDMYLIAEELKTMSDGEAKKAVLESIDSVTENLSYINKIVSDLQDYTRPLKPTLQTANLSELIEGSLLTINVPERIEVLTDVAPSAKEIKTDVAYCRRILTNLMTNAVQAMPNEGKLTIRAVKNKHATTITIEDTGVGIPEHVKTKMFTPLFTTKSKGQGLGLAVVKRLVESLNGTISFESEADKGTKFILQFPTKNPNDYD